jgi:hypothetical protein
MRLGSALFFGIAVIPLAVGVASSQLPYQGPYNRGQDVVPVYEGWRPSADGTFTMYFGYFNRNYQEELDIPIGPDNKVDPDGDRGQPTHFYPRRQFFVFKIVVPKDWGLERRVIWTLSARGRTYTAKGWLQPDWEINDEVMMENAGASNDPENERPVITGSGQQAVTLPNSVTLTATAQDDGRPRLRRQRSGDETEASAQGLNIRWIQYRGPRTVTFSPPVRVGGDGKPLTSTTEVSFKVPGIYVLRAIASDGLLDAVHDITVIVK